VKGGKERETKQQKEEKRFSEEIYGEQVKTEAKGEVLLRGRKKTQSSVESIETKLLGKTN